MNEKKVLSSSEVIAIIASALNIPADRISPSSKAADFAEWDSMGTLGLVATLDRHGVKMDLGDASTLQSVEGVFGAFRKAGRLA